MHWVTEREEWLASWNDATNVGELTFPSYGAAPAAVPAAGRDEGSFFSDVIEAGSRSFVCRATGSTVDIFDISPASQCLTSWRVHLPSPVISSVGISHASDAGGSMLYMMFLTKSQVICCVEAALSQTGLPELRCGPSGPCRLASPASAFCALGRSHAAVGCLDGTLAVIHVGAEGSYELADASILRRFMRSQAPPVLALATAGPGPAGLRLLSFAADGRVQLWEVSETRGKLVASSSTSGTHADQASPAQIRVCETNKRACLLASGSLRLLDLAAAASGNLSVQEVQAPFPGAYPVVASLSQAALWAVWSGSSRERLLRLDLETRSAQAWKDASLAAASLTAASGQELVHAALIGAAAFTSSGVGPAAPQQVVYSLLQQQEVWRSEEESFDELRAAGASAAARDAAEERALKWWAGRAFLPGRFSSATVAAALKEAGGWPLGGLLAGAEPHRRQACGALRRAVETHLRSQAAVHVSRGGAEVPFSQTMSILATAAMDFLRICDAIGRPERQPCGMGTSGAWAPHAWLPTSGLGSGGAPVCPLILYSGGVSCVRAMHAWMERWWATCHVSRELSNYDKVEIEDVLGLSPLVEWKFCVTAWFLTQCVGSANLALAISASQSRSSPASSVLRLVQDVPKNLATHVRRSAQWLENGALGAELHNLEGLLRVFCQGSGAEAPSSLATEKESKLADVLCGGVAVSGGELACASLRDLMFLGAYAQAQSEWATQRASPEWTSLAGLLDQELPVCSALQQSTQLEASSRKQLRAADLWASSCRASGCSGGARLSSVRSYQFAVLLLRQEAWEALHEWCAQGGMAAFAAYAQAREALAIGQAEQASAGFLKAEADAAELMRCLKHDGPSAMEVEGEAPATVAFYEHVATLFGSRRLHKDEYSFLHRAATMASRQPGAPKLQQRLWAAVFDRALASDLLAGACEAIQKLDRFEEPVRALAQKLRRDGRTDLLLGLPEKYQAVLIASLHEHASLGSPVPGSESLACYHHLYALHFASQEFAEAATIAQTLYIALAGGSCEPSTSVGREADEPMHETFLQIRAGDCTSQGRNVPRKRGLCEEAQRNDGSEEGAAAMTDIRPVGQTYDWALLDQQRSALLMLVSALSLSPSQLLMVPTARSESMDDDTQVAASSSGDRCRAAALECAAQEWFSRKSSSSRDTIVTLPDAERRLALVEARMVLYGQASSGSSQEAAPPAVARRVAELGLLILALRVARGFGLDVWQYAFQPFLQLCLKADSSTDGEVSAIADAARGPAQALMFVSSDGLEPLGSNGDVRRAWWQTLEEGLRSCRREGLQEGFLDARSARLYSLVADEILTQKPSDALPEFVEQGLSSGPSWVSLLRIYMKHQLLQDAVALLDTQLQRCSTSASKVASIGMATAQWSPLDDLPVCHMLQLEKAIKQRPQKEKSGSMPALVKELDRVLSGFKKLLEEQE